MRQPSRFTQVDSDSEPLFHSGGVASSDCEEETQAVLFCPCRLFFTHANSDMDIQATVLDRPSSPPPSLLQHLQDDPAMGSEVGGTVPEQFQHNEFGRGWRLRCRFGGRIGGRCSGPPRSAMSPGSWVVVGMAGLEGLVLHTIFRRRVIAQFQFVEGRCHSRTQVAFEEWGAWGRVAEVRAWKLFLLILRMLLHRPPRGGLVPRK